jgi:hypothetical protein
VPGHGIEQRQGKHVGSYDRNEHGNDKKNSSGSEVFEEQIEHDRINYAKPEPGND